MGRKENKEGYNNRLNYYYSANAVTIILQTFAVFFFMISATTSDASLIDLNHGEKTVSLMNNHTNYLSIRCFSFDSNITKIQHLAANEQLSFTFKTRMLIPSATMFNCSTNMGSFIVYKYDYECAEDKSYECSWKFDINRTYQFLPRSQIWVAKDYNPNYESLDRGGVVAGRYIG